MILFSNMLQADNHRQTLRIDPPPVLYAQQPNKGICPHDIYINSLIPCAACQDAAGHYRPTPANWRK